MNIQHLIEGDSAESPPPTTKSSTTWKLHLKRPLLWLIPLGVGALWLPEQMWDTLLVGYLSLLLIAYLWVRSLARGVSAERQVSTGWVSVGDKLRDQFTLTHSGWFPALWVEVRDQSNIPNYPQLTVRRLLNRKVVWQQQAICTRRGQFHIGPWDVTVRDPLGIFSVTHHYPRVADIIIFPPIHTGIPIRLPTGASGGQVDARGHSWEATTRAASIRAYQPSDPFRWIHWPSTARTNQLTVRQFDRDEGGDLWVLVDVARAIQLETEENNSGEQAILLATAMLAEAIRNGRATGLALYGTIPKLIAPARQQSQQWKLLRALALAKIDGQHPLEVGVRDLGRSAKRGSSVMIVTVSESVDWLPEMLHLMRRGIRVSVVLLDRETFGVDGNSWALHNSIRKLGVACTVLAAGEVGQPIEQRSTL